LIRVSGSGHRKHERFRRAVVVAAASVLIAAMWWVASVPWGLPLLDVVPFVGPGALLGLGAGWAAQAATKWRWTWRTAARSAVVGGVVLAPIIVFAIGIEGNVRPERLVSAFVRGAWFALAFGALVAGVRALRLHKAAQGAARAESAQDRTSESTRRRA
jgi:hypothetical protein